MAGVLRPALAEAGWKGDAIVHDFLVAKDWMLLSNIMKELELDPSGAELPKILEPASYFYTFFFLPRRSLVLMGHPPRDRVAEALTLQGLPRKLVLAQEEMHGPGTRYELWDLGGTVMSFPLDTGLKEALTAAGWLTPPGAGR